MCLQWLITMLMNCVDVFVNMSQKNDDECIFV